jgi:acetyltransferase-like isoleucine patch superfamily enzyme
MMDFPPMNRFLLKIKNGDTAFYRFLRTLARFFLYPRAPILPLFFKPVLAALYQFHFFVIRLSRMMVTVLYRHPLLQGRCASMGRNVSIDGLPFINGHCEIYIGDDAWLGGRITIQSGRFLDNPRFLIGARSKLSWNLNVTVNREVIVEEDVLISYDCRISDSDGHPRQLDLRLANAPLDPRDIRPVRICRGAWIGNGSHIMKGVTIGEGAIIGANSVVITDIPPFALAFGNPAEVYFKNHGKPSRKPPL